MVSRHWEISSMACHLGSGMEPTASWTHLMLQKSVPVSGSICRQKGMANMLASSMVQGSHTPLPPLAVMR